ncbi:DoxX family protein [uncultured Microscilla sp.]|uniref:DoxX family protein n=1 Tax=uncultured Microscilla sp. TaxID=432653 RepID=UPI002607D6DB|nr:DoxX family protein [uncultured Microscilla sp.]
MVLLDNLLPILDLSTGAMVVKSIIALYFAILFLQSGIDKVVNWQGNLSWLTGYFSKTFLKDRVPAMLGVIAVTEVVAGAFSAIGIVELLLMNGYSFALYGAALSTLNFVMLFFGQRIAQDYDAAAAMTNYFTIGVIAMIILGVPL